MTRTEPSTPAVALVTGVSRGIGAAVARRLAAGGVAVACAATEADNAMTVVSEIQGSGGRAMAVELRVQDVASGEAAL